MANITKIGLQDAFLNQVRKERVPVTVTLMNGFDVKGLVAGFDNFTVIVESEEKQRLLYKHAIAVVAPSKKLSPPVKEETV